MASDLLPPPPRDALFLRPREHVERWREIGASPAVLRTLTQGVQLKFYRKLQPYCARPIPVREDDREWLRGEVAVNLARGSWVPAARQPAYCAPAFIVCHPVTGKRRLVIDLRQLNDALIIKGTKYDTLKALRYMLERDDWMISCDLESGYHHIGIHSNSVQYLGFELNGEYFYCTALPFGLATAPRIFTKVMRAVVGYVRGGGTRCLPYLDDFLFMLRTQLDSQTAGPALVGAGPGTQRKEGLLDAHATLGAPGPSHRLDDADLCTDTGAGLASAGVCGGTPATGIQEDARGAGKAARQVQRPVRESVTGGARSKDAHAQPLRLPAQDGQLDQQGAAVATSDGRVGLVGQAGLASRRARSVAGTYADSRDGRLGFGLGRTRAMQSCKRRRAASGQCKTWPCRL